MKLLNGKAIANRIRADIRQRITKEKLRPGLAVILVGNDPASHLYVGLKEKACAEVGITFTKVILPEDTRATVVKEYLERFNADDTIHGILVQLPLPRHLKENDIIRAIDPKKDVDGFHPENIRAFVSGKKVITPGLARTICTLLTETGLNLEGSNAVILSNAKVFARPIIALLKRHGIGAEHVAPSGNFREQTRNADILITAIGQPELITQYDIKNDAILIDVGTTKRDTAWIGDIHQQSVSEKAGWLTPVPGGVGPVTVATLLENVVQLASQ